MLRTLLTRLMISANNIFSGGKLFRLKKEISNLNTYEKHFNKTLLYSYLKKWGQSTDINDYPLITKDDIRKYVNNVNPKKIYKISYTGGSTGEPLKVVYSKHRALVRTAAALYYNEILGYKYGDSYLLTRSRDRSSIIKYLKNEILFIPNDLSHTKLKELFDLISEKRIKFLIGYPSVIYELSVWIKSNNYETTSLVLKAFISTAEPIEPEQSKFISQILGCPVYSRYANEESGIMAQQLEHEGDFIVDKYNLYVEILNPDTLLPVKEGEVGKVVITDVCSDLYPFIRYDTGDFAEVAKYNSDGDLISIRKIVGRVVDQFYKTNGHLFSPLTLGPFIRLPLTELGLYFQFQFAQTGAKEYQLRLKVNNVEIPEHTIRQILHGLKKTIGLDAEISIILVSDIPARPSGKRLLYVNEATVPKITTLSI